jgi:signal recognition particle receptor subunit beta
MYINWKRKELIITIALYGPSQSGKTTTWHVLSEGADSPPEAGSDTFSLHLENVQDKQVILHVRDVPGESDAAEERRVALYGVDGLIFVADSEAARLEANRASLDELEANLTAMGKSIHTMPFLFQYNKRDLPTALPVAEIQQHLNPDRLFPHQETSATYAEGVLDVLRQATDLVLTTAL